MVLKNIKSFTALKLIDAIINNPQESRREWMLKIFEQHGQQNNSNYRYQFWQHSLPRKTKWRGEPAYIAWQHCCIAVPLIIANRHPFTGIDDVGVDPWEVVLSKN